MEKSTPTLAFLVAFLVVISCFSNEIEAARNPKEVAGLPSFRVLEGQKKPRLAPMEGGGCVFWWDCSKICPPGCDAEICDHGHCACTCT
ncbi:hypothetical protein ACFX2A_034239 [Malus domestica]